MSGLFSSMSTCPHVRAFGSLSLSAHRRLAFYGQNSEVTALMDRARRGCREPTRRERDVTQRRRDEQRAAESEAHR